MEDTDILRHLLKIEARAAALVDDAQAEADKRIKAAEEENRRLYEERRLSLVTELEAASREEMAAARAEYGAALDAFRAENSRLPLDRGAFGALAFSLLLGEPLPGSGPGTGRE